MQPKDLPIVDIQIKASCCREARREVFLTDPEKAAEQAVQIAREHHVTSTSGVKLDLKVMTLCIHGDTPGSPEIAQAVRKSLESAKISVEPLHQILE